MKRIIDIPEEDYKRFISYKSNKYAPTIHEVDTLMLAVANSTPLNECEAENCISRKNLKEDMIRYGWHHPDSTITEYVEDLPSVYPKSDKLEKIQKLIEYWNDTNSFDTCLRIKEILDD